MHAPLILILVPYIIYMFNTFQPSYLFILIIPQLLSQYISNQTETRTVVWQYVLYSKTGPI